MSAAVPDDLSVDDAVKQTVPLAEGCRRCAINLEIGQTRIRAVAMVYHSVLPKPVAFVPTLRLVIQLTYGQSI